MTRSARRVLFVSPAFFGYEADIVAALESHGSIVRYFDERPSNSSLAKAVFRVGGSVLNGVVARYYRRILRDLSDFPVDTFILIKGEVVPRFFLEELRARNPDARFVYYSFDALPEGSNPTTLFDLFDVLYSFDPADVERFDRLELKHLFYSDVFGPSRNAERAYELSFVGTLHSDRYRFVTRLLAGFERTHTFFFAPAAWYFALTKYVTRKFSEVAWSEVSFEKLSKQEVAQIFRESDAVLDIQRSGQTGLTMRTFEVLASGAILVTGNSAIRDAEIYDPARVIVIENYADGSAALELKRLIAERVPTPGAPAGFERHHVREWVSDLLGVEK